MFAFGDDGWPGIAKLIEESGEVLQVCGKLMMTHGEPVHWNVADLRAELENELGDLAAAIEFVIKYCSVDPGKISARKREKLATFERWHLT